MRALGVHGGGQGAPRERQAGAAASGLLQHSAPVGGTRGAQEVLCANRTNWADLYPVYIPKSSYTVEGTLRSLEKRGLYSYASVMTHELGQTVWCVEQRTVYMARTITTSIATAPGAPGAGGGEKRQGWRRRRRCERWGLRRRRRAGWRLRRRGGRYGA